MSMLDIAEIQRVLPHRYPMLLVDRILECDDKQRIVGLKNVTVNEPFFQGHFPGLPVMPGVLQLEAMAQTAGVLLNRMMKEDERGVPYFMAIDKAKFRRVVRPGDQLKIEVNFLTIKRRVARFRAEIKVDGELASEAEMLCMVTDNKPRP
jgi:beta-hydroxyacyl-ACP dehydratase FabZ